MFALPLPVMVVDADGHMLALNDATQEYLQISATRSIGQSLRQLLGEEHMLIELVHGVHASGTPTQERHVLIAPHGGNRSHHADVFLFPMTAHDNTYGIILQPRGFSAHIDQQAAVQKSAAHLSGIASILAHEIKNPLAGIRGAAQLLALGAGADEKPLTQLITDETDRISRLLSNMEEFGVNSPQTYARFNIHQVLERVKQLALAGFANTVEFIEDYDPSLPDVLGSKDQMIQLLLNLVKNATEAMAHMEHLRIHMRTAFNPGLWVLEQGTHNRIHVPLEICIEDNGPGIAAEMKPFLFEPFMTNKPSGRGLGLALAAKIVSDHGGVIDVDSKPGCTIFRILLPMKK